MIFGTGNFRHTTKQKCGFSCVLTSTSFTRKKEAFKLIMHPVRAACVSACDE